MDKDEFLRQANASPGEATKAWEMSNGNPEQAEKLLEPVTLRLNAKFRGSGDRFGGLIHLTWNFREKASAADEVIVSTSDQVLEVPIDLPPSNYLQRIKQLKSTGQQMGGNTETLATTLKKELQDTDSALRKALNEGDLPEIDTELQNLITNNLDLSQPRFSSEVKVNRQLDQERSTQSEAEESDEDADEEEYEFQAEVEIDPVEGIPVEKLSIGDKIYVDLGNYSPQLQKIAQVLEKRRDDTGLIPAQLVSREVSEAGTLALRVQFGQNVFGRARCGKDVSILVPKSTASKKGAGLKESQINPVEVIENYWPLILPLIVTLLIIVIVISIIFP